MASPRNISVHGAPGHTGVVTMTAGGEIDDLNQLLNNIHFPPSVFQGNSETTMNKDRSQFVVTESFKDAELFLQERRRVILCGPPGSGKTTLAYALCRRWRDQGFAVFALERLGQWKSRVGEQERSVVVLDGTFGKVRVDSQQHACWERIVDTPLEALRLGSCRLIITVYPHVLRELQQLESNLDSPLLDDIVLVDLSCPLQEEEKHKMLDYHLKKLKLAIDSQKQIVERIVRNDVSGPIFPWCCGHMVRHWPSEKDPDQWKSSEDPTAIFSFPAEAYVGLLKQMVLDNIHGAVFAAVFCLIMKGAYNFLHHQTETARHLQELGFYDFPLDTLAQYEDVLRGSVLKEGTFSSRVLYDAAGLALRRFFRLPTLLKVCDIKFLVQYVHITVTGSIQSEDMPPVLCITGGSLTNAKTNRCEKLQADDYQSLVQRIFAEIVQGNLQHICQHPSLQCPEFLQELVNYCSDDRQRMEQLLNAVDAVYQLPLLYWSAFHPSHHLTHWCLSEAQANKQLSARVFMACSLFDNITRNPTCRLQSSLQNTLTARHFRHLENIMDFPLPDQCLARNIQKQIDIITEADSTQGRLLYLLNPALPIPLYAVTVRVTQDKLQLQIEDKCHWYLVFRLLTDRAVCETDQDGNTLLHIAASSGQSAAMTLSLKAGAVITKQNRQGVTPYQLAHETRARAAKNRNKMFLNLVFARFPNMDMVEVQLFLLQEISVNDEDSEGRTGLLVACREGRGDIADLYIELGAKVDVEDAQSSYRGFVSVLGGARDTGCTPLHYACMYGLKNTAELLIQHRAKVTASTTSGITALHLACACRSHSASADITRLLLHAGADVNMKNEDGDTPLLWAAMNGYSDTNDLLIRQGADVNVVYGVGFTPLMMAVFCGHSDKADQLICQGANVNVKTEEGYTPLMLAAMNGQSDTAALLIRQGENVNMPTEKGFTPLLLAAMNGQSDTADLLIRQGGNVNVQNEDGYTPLLAAAMNGHSDTADLLIRQGAHVDIQNEHGDTPLLLASRNGHSDTADLLKRYGAINHA